MSDFSGLFVKDADKGIIKTLKEKDLLFEQRQIHHRYPLLLALRDAFNLQNSSHLFVSVEKIKERLLLAVKDIYWMPNHIKEAVLESGSKMHAIGPFLGADIGGPHFLFGGV